MKRGSPSGGGITLEPLARLWSSLAASEIVLGQEEQDNVSGVLDDSSSGHDAGSREVFEDVDDDMTTTEENVLPLSVQNLTEFSSFLLFLSK